MPSRGSAPSPAEGLEEGSHEPATLPASREPRARRRALWWSFGLSVLNYGKQTLDQRMQVLLLIGGQRGVKHCGQLGCVGGASVGEPLPAGICQGDPAGAAVGSVKLAADQP